MTRLEAESLVLRAMAALIEMNLDSKRETVARRLRGQASPSDVHYAVTRIYQKELIRISEKRSDGGIVYALTDEGWHQSGVKKPFWLMDEAAA
jgi:DNA-binding MarR family transcriptional regulator